MLDTNIYIQADRDRQWAEQLIAFYWAFLPFTYLHAVVVQELLLGAVDAKRGLRIQDVYIKPFETRNRLITPSYQSWKRSGELIAALIRRKLLSPGRFRRSFLNDALLAVSCREAGVTLVTTNKRDFVRLQSIERFEFVTPWPSR